MLVIMVLQIPLFFMTKWMKGYKFGNYFFWFGLIIGPSFIAACYIRVD
jgi:hypothetical protein